MSVNDVVRPGPPRWKRAVDAAIAKPESHHAALLFERLNRVRGLETANRRYWKVERHERNHYYCSDFCAGLAIHLEAYIGDREFQFSSYEDIISAIRATRTTQDPINIGWGIDMWSKTTLRQIFPRVLPRNVKCFTCGGEMSKNYLTSGNPLVDFTYALALAQAYERPVTEVTLSDTPQLADWERELLKDSDAGKTWITSDGEILSERPTDYVELNLTRRELAILKFVEKEHRHAALNALKYV